MKTDEPKWAIVHPFVFNIILCLFGIIIVLLGHYALHNILLTAFGVPLAATGMIGFFTSWLVAPRLIDEITKIITDRFGGPACFLPERRFLTGHYNDRMQVAQEIDIISLSLEAFQNNFPEQELCRWVLTEGKRIRMLVLSPNGKASEIRGREENHNLKQKIEGQIEHLRHHLFLRLDEEIKKGVICKGSFAVSLYDACPYYAYFRADNEIILGFYYSNRPGNLSECLHLRDNEHDVHKKLRAHFDDLWLHSNKGESSDWRVICEVSGAKAIFNDL